MILWIIAAVLAFYIKGLCGFANTLVFTSILGFGADNVNISPVELMLGYPANLIMVVKNRAHLNRRIWLPFSLILLAGSIPGAILLKNTDARYLKIFFGAVVILVALEMFLRERSTAERKGSKVIAFLVVLISGVLCGLFGIGAPMAAYVSLFTRSSDEFKANISAIFFAENTFRVIFYGIVGIITLESLKTALSLLPFVLLGLFGGILSAKVLNEKTARSLVILLLAISGIMLIVNNLPTG